MIMFRSLLVCFLMMLRPLQSYLIKLHQPKRIKAFTLVELSIVIVIIGIIIAGVTAGQSLVKQARVRTLMTNIENVRTAVNTFKLEYDKLPGDMNNANFYWPSAANPGNNDGKIVSTSLISANISGPESYAAWQHLSLAGLIPGSFTGVNGSGAAIGVNVPPSGYGNKSAMWFCATELWGTYPTSSTKLVVGGTVGFGTTDYKISVLDAYNIDVKMDDGLPYTGYAVTFTYGVDNLCIAKSLLYSRAEKLASVYKLDVPTDKCTMIFPINGGALKP